MAYTKGKFRKSNKKGVRRALKKAYSSKRKMAIVKAVDAVNQKVNRIAKAMPQANRLYYQRNFTGLLGAGGSYQSYNLLKFAN